jgi:hypothetical protein
MKFLARNFLYKNYICNHYFSLLNTVMGKGKDPDPYLRQTDPDADKGGLKTYGSGTLI